MKHELLELRRRVAELELELEKTRHALRALASASLDGVGQSGAHPLVAPSMDARTHAPASQGCEPLQVEAYLERVRRAVLQIMPHGPPTLERIARQMHSSSRTMQRRLWLLGTTHRRLVEELRKELALGYVGLPALSVTEMAYLLGYSDVSGFRRAFKKWTGRPPARARTPDMVARRGS